MSILLRSSNVRFAVLTAFLAILPSLPALVQPTRLIYPSWSDFSDLTLIHWPKALLVRESLAQGHAWPLWSPYALSGQPLAANQLAMLFYPAALLLLVGPMAWSFCLFYALHLAWAAVGTYYLVRGLGLQPRSALLAGVIFALCGKVAAHSAIGHASLVPAIAWTPWAFAFLHRGLARSSAVFSVLAGVALAAQVTTHTYALVYTAYGLLLYALLYLALAPGTASERWREAWHRVPRLALIPAMALLLGAAQLLPLLEMAPHSNRALSLAEATRFSLSPVQTLTGILFPTPNVGHEHVIYPGLLTLGLAAAAWPARRERPVIIFAALFILGVLLAMGNHTPLYHVAYATVPGLRWMRTPVRLWFFLSLGLAVLAAYGFEQWQLVWRRPAQLTIRLALVAGIGFSAATSLGVLLVLDQRGRGAWGLGVFGLLSGFLLLWAIGRRPSPRFAWLALLLLMADLLSFDLTLFRLAPVTEVLAQGRDAASWLAAQPGDYRVYSPSYSLPQPAAAEAGLRQIDGVEPVHLADYDRFMALAGGYDDDSFSVTIPPFPDEVPIDHAHRDSVPNLRLLGLLNSRYLVAAFPLELPGLELVRQQKDAWIYENEFALPRAFVVHRVQPVTRQEAWQQLETLDPARIALVEGGMPLNGQETPTPAQIVEQSTMRLVVQVHLDAPGLLVLSEIWYPGWQASDNGAEVPILRTDAILRGVYLDAGPHTVDFEYRPWTVKAGVAITVSTVVIVSIAATYWLWRRA